MIKFRAWVKPGVLSNHLDGVIAEAKPDFIERVCLVKRDDLIGNGCFDEIFDFEDIILMQSTGLKDLKGVEIFEGDVVWIIDKEEMDNGWGWFEEVKFRNGSFMVGDDFLINSHHCCVVHGNIYEQPELLGGQA